MHGFGRHTYSWINAAGQRTWIKYHFKTKQGIKNFTREEAGEMAGKDPDFATRDLFEAIQRGEFPAWRVCVQLMTEAEAETFPYNPFDLTKVWPHRDFPLMDIGEMVLDRNPSNYFAEIEQAAFEPANIVAGIGFSPDKMLQARLIDNIAVHYLLGELGPLGQHVWRRSTSTFSLAPVVPGEGSVVAPW